MITQPTITANCTILLGYLAAAFRGQPYQSVDIDPSKGRQIIEHENGNRYSVEIRQISGVE
jgi:hypothetical protein